MVVTDHDARIVGVAREVLAEEAARAFGAAIRAERLRFAPAKLVQGAWQAGLALLFLVAAIRLLHHATRWARARLERWCERWLEARGLRKLGESRVRSLVRGSAAWSSRSKSSS